MTRVPSEKSTIRIEYWFTIFSFLALSGALSPFFYDLIGSKSEDFTDVNPMRLIVTSIIYMICGAIAIYHWGRSRDVLLSNSFILVLFLLPLVSMLWSVDKETTLRRAVAHLLTGALCIYIVSRLSPEELLRRLTVCFFIGGVASLFYCAALPGIAIHHGPGLEGSWKGIYGHKNELGRVSAIAVIAAGFMTSKTRMQEYLRYGTMVLFVFLLIMSQSRTNWFILAAMGGVVPVTRFMRNGSISRGIRVVCFLLAATFLVLAVTVEADALLAAVGRDATFSGRATLWHGVNVIIAERYPIWGAGYGAFFTEKGAIYELAPYISYWSGVPNHAHSGYLNTRANLGIPGVIALSLFIFVAGYRLISRIMIETDRKVWAGFCALFFLFLVNNFSESVAFKHSDIAWAIILMIYVYAQPVRVVVRRKTGASPVPAGGFISFARTVR